MTIENTASTATDIMNTLMRDQVKELSDISLLALAIDTVATAIKTLQVELRSQNLGHETHILGLIQEQIELRDLATRPKA